jgi:NarL family two-component system response regulator LiaR
MTINGLGSWLTATGRFLIAGIAGSLEEARALFQSAEALPEIIILDVSLGASPSKEASASKEGGDGLALIPELKAAYARRNAALRILVYTMHENPFIVKRAMDLGAAAYVAKSSESGEITAAIDAILAGKTYFKIDRQPVNPENAPFALTRRENEIAVLVKQSLNTRQIAKRLGLSIRTVEHHLEHIFDKTGISSWEELHDL